MLNKCVKNKSEKILKNFKKCVDKKLGVVYNKINKTKQEKNREHSLRKGENSKEREVRSTKKLS